MRLIAMDLYRQFPYQVIIMPTMLGIGSDKSKLNILLDVVVGVVMVFHATAAQYLTKNGFIRPNNVNIIL